MIEKGTLKIGDKIIWIVYDKTYEVIGFAEHGGVFLKDEKGWHQHKKMKTILTKFKKV
jgi:hypothetical protein